ncbi:MAG: glycosyltransferase [Candidatus Sumerlaeia bacterium]
MSKILLVGMGPLFEKGVRNFGGQCLRTWCFAQPLIEDGHDLKLVTLPIYNPDDKSQETASLDKRKTDKDFSYLAFSNLDFEFIHLKLTEIAKEFQPDAIVAVNNTPAWVCARLPVKAPLWCDLFGYEMAEKQARAARTGDGKCLLDSWKKEGLMVRRSDKFSMVSRPQLQALLGEMAMVGRLNQYTFHYHFAHHIPTVCHPVFLELDPEKSKAKDRLIRGVKTPEDAFILLWSGGYNFWTDSEFLFGFLDQAMAQNPDLHYVSTGGAIAGYNPHTYERFCELVEGSEHKERYHLLGWVDASDLPQIYMEADLGLNIDEPNYETMFGARNRINNMMAAGMPVLTTYGSEISWMIGDAGCGIIVPPNDADALVKALTEIAHEPERRAELGARSRKYAREEWKPEKLTSALRDWAEEPGFAPDNAEKLRRFPEADSFLDSSLHYVEEIAAVAESTDLLKARQAQIKVEQLRARGWYKALKFSKAFFKGIARIFSRRKNT